MTTESGSNKNGSDEQIHSEAFDTAAAQHTDPNPGKTTDQDGKQNGEVGDEAAQVDAGAQGAKGEDDGKAGEVDKEQGDPDYKVLFEKEKQRNRSWEGRISRAERVARELAEENERLKASPGKTSDDTADTGNTGAGDHAQVLTTEEETALADFSANYSEVDQALQIAIKKALANKENVGDVLDRVAKIEKRFTEDRETARTNHLNALEEAHPGYMGNYVETGELDAWIESLPYKDAVRYQQIRERGNTKDALSLLDEFATATGKKLKGDTQETDNQPNLKKDRLESLTTVRRHSGKPAAGGGSPSKEDFEGGFERGAATHTR